MHGENVFFPIGFDAFGLPAENAAIKNGINPRDWTMQNIEHERRQFRSMGAVFDWRYELVTCEPEFYRWNQWMFLRFLEAGLAYRRMSPVDWCPNDGTLAREQVEGADRHCWRCGAPVEKRDLEQWYLRTTKYADELLDFTRHRLAGADPAPADELDRPVSEGAEIVFTTAPDDHQPGGDELRVFTTRPDTLFGATFMVLAPEHAARRRSSTAPDRRAEVEAYIARAQAETEIERLSTEREKTGVYLGADAINPVNGERIPIWIADYVLAGYGTGAIMAVPAHDERDFAFATPVRAADPAGHRAGRDGRRRARSTTRTSPTRPTSGWSTRAGSAACPRRTGCARSSTGWPRTAGPRPTVTYRLRDWLFSRQRYWGTPIPVIYCERDGIVPVPDEDLPVRLPDTVDYRGRGENPLNHDEAFLRVACPRCGEPGPPRDRHDGHVRRLVVVLVPLPVAAQGRRARSTARWSIAGRRSTSTPAAPSTRSCTCCTAGSGPRRCATSASSPRTSRSSGCSTRARSWAPTASG